MFELRSAANFALVANTCTTCFSASATWSDEAGHNRTPPRRVSTARSVSMPQLLFSLAELPHVADDVWDAAYKKCSWPVLARLWWPRWRWLYDDNGDGEDDDDDDDDDDWWWWWWWWCWWCWWFTMVMEALKTVTGSAHNVASWFLCGRVVRSKDYVIPCGIC